MTYTYPPSPATLEGDVLSISRFLNSPTLVARRLRTIAEQRFIADVLLPQKFNTTSGSVIYETGETIYTDDQPSGVTPGSEYPLTAVSQGDASIAKTVKWGQDVEVTDEAISRQLMNPVERAFTKMVNNMVRTVDTVAMSAINSAVTQNTAAIGSWASGDTAGAVINIFRDITRAKARIIALNQGYDPDYVVVDDVTFANAISDPKFSLLLPRESSTAPVVTGAFPVVAGMTILPTPNGLAGNALVVDSKQLGGMAFEDIGGPGYVSAGQVGIQVKTIRQDEEDRWRLRCRRITVPIVQEPAAAWKITGVAA